MGNLVDRASEYLSNEELRTTLQTYFSEEEKEVAQKILDHLKGTEFFEATKIMKLCEAALLFKKIE